MHGAFGAAGTAFGGGGIASRAKPEVVGAVNSLHVGSARGGWNDGDWGELYPPVVSMPPGGEPPAAPSVELAEPDADMGVPDYLALISKAARQGGVITSFDQLDG